MAANDITFTPANVIALNPNLLLTAPLESGVTGVQGDLMHLVNGELIPSACDLAAPQAVVDVMLMSAGSTGQSVSYVRPGAEIDLGANSAKIGENLTLSDVQAKFGPESDRVVGNLTTTIGSMRTATILVFTVKAYGVSRAS